MIVEFNPLALRALPLYSLTETQGERRVNSITSTSGIFNPTPRRYAPQLSPYILRYKTQGRRVRVTLRSLQCDTPAYGARQGRSLEVALYSFAMNKRSGLYFSNSTPSPCGHSPYIPLRKHRGRGGLTLLLPILVFLTPLLVATLLSSPLCFRKKI